MTKKLSTSDQVLPLAAGIVFLAVVIAALRLCAGTWASVAANPPEEDYRLALYAAMTPSSDWTSYALYKLDHPTVFVTWTKSQWIPSFQKKASTNGPIAGTDLWVTDAASLKKFCQDYVRSHGTDPNALAMRLKQRLGLPPNSMNDTFVELLVDPAQKSNIFRPCSDPDARLDGPTCASPTNFPREADAWDEASSAKTSLAKQEWILRKYYSSYASLNPYPWTELGYTFDWARDADANNQFVRRGQTEFVIPKGDSVHFVSAASTITYCESY